MIQQTDPRDDAPQNTGSQQEKANRLNEDFQVPDLDGDGIIGHTGGNFGDTTYTGGSLIDPQPGPVEDAPQEPADDDKER